MRPTRALLLPDTVMPDGNRLHIHGGIRLGARVP